MKAPMGSASVKSGANTKALFNATDCYFDITGDYTSVLTKYEQALDSEGRLLFKDESGKAVYEDFVEVDGTAEAVYTYVDDGTVVPDDVELTPKDDMTQPYQVAVYTIQSLDGIVSLTNIKAVGNYTFVLIEDINIDIDIGTDDGGDNEVVDVENNETADTDEANVEDDPVIEEVDNEESPEETGGEQN